jgi:hypothetical protein
LFEEYADCFLPASFSVDDFLQGTARSSLHYYYPKCSHCIHCERQTLMIDVLKESILALKQTNFLIARLQSDIYPTQLFNLQNNNSNDD